MYLAIGYTIYVCGGPGILLPEGTPLGALGLVFWALAASRPGPWKKRIEWFAGACALTAQTTWMGIVFWFALPWLFVGYGCWSVWGGWLMKKLAARLPLSIATPLAWIGFESLLTWTPPPIGLSWLRLGHYLNDWPLLAGSGRVWGVMGLGFVLAAIAGFLADLWRSRHASDSREISRASILGLALPVALGAVLALVVPVPATTPGPRLLLVDPAFPQARKQSSGRPDELFGETFDLTRQSLLNLRERGEREPDLVCWGETLLPYPLVGPDVIEGIADLVVDPWSPLYEGDGDQRRRALENCMERERQVGLSLYGGEYSPGRFIPPTLGESTSFLAGAEVLVAREGRLRRTNSVVLWGPGHVRAGRGEKTHLAPGGETMVGLENFEFVRDIIFEVAGYVPDFASGEGDERLRLSGASGESWSFGATVCFDNAFSDVYAAPLRGGPVDFHLVVSNEAWYEDSQELDQMVAFSRMHALCTGRAIVRCVNSGVSGAFGVRGEELARLTVGGVDRQVRGTLVVDVPVPLEDEAATTPFVWLEPWLEPLAALLPLLVLAAFRQRPILPEAEA